MKYRLAIVVVVAVVAIGTISYCSRRPTRFESGPTAESIRPGGESLPAGGATNRIPGKPDMFKYKEFPPKTPEAKAMWDWWLAMDKSDPSFQWKMPIEFYGIVLDQFNQPVAEADVAMVWTTMDGNEEKRLKSDRNGKFSLTGAKGKRLSVRVLKGGYARTTSVIQSFEYGAFFDEEFHVSNARKPVVFRLRKLIAPEPLYVFSNDGSVRCDGAPLVIDIETGQISAAGELEFTIQHPQPTPDGLSYNVTLNARSGGGIVMESGEFATTAPEDGYTAKNTLKLVARNGVSEEQLVVKLYAKTKSGKYARIILDFAVKPRDGSATFRSGIFYNPSGSRNVEYDHRLRLNR